MAINPKRLVPVNVGRGIANRVDETAVPVVDPREGTPGAARDAVNTDIRADSTATRRDGYQLRVELPGAHSLYSPPSEAFALVAAGDTLYRVDEALGLTAIATGLAGGPVSYATIANRVRWSDGSVAGEVDVFGEARPWGVATPVPSFTATAVATGGLHAGRYQVTITYVTANREEGGAPESVFVTVAEGGGIKLDNLPVPAEAHVVALRIYVGAGDVLYHAATVATGVTATTVGTHTPTVPLETQFMYPLPPGQFLLARQGRLFAAQGRRLYWSRANHYALCKPAENTVPFPGQIVMVAAPDGVGLLIYVGTPTKTWALTGESIDTATLSPAWPRGAVAGSMAMVPADALGLESAGAVPCWLDTDGQFVAGTPGGVVALSKLAVADTMRECAATFIDAPGLRRYLVSGRREGPSRMAMGDRAIAEIVHVGDLGQ